MEIVKKVTPPAGVTRLLFRLPLYLYRSGLGWLFGHRLMVVNHIGRITGKRRQAVLEVVDHDANDGSYVVASGWGPMLRGTATSAIRRRSRSRLAGARYR